MEIDILHIAIVIGVILVSMTLHEAMHGFMAYYLGDDTAKLQGRLTLNPVKHIDPFLTLLLPLALAIIGGPIFGGAKPVPFNPNRVRYDEWGAALVAISGPIVNLLLAFITFGVYVVAGPSLGVIGTQIIMTAVGVNLGFFIFNVLPIPPLDGSRVMYALAPDFVRRGMEMIEQYGFIILLALVFFAGPLFGTIMTSAMQAIINAFMLVYGVA